MRTILFISMLVIATNLWAQDNFKPIQNQEKVKEVFITQGNNFQTITSNFVQEKYLEYLSSTIISKGKFWYKRDNLLRWEYTEPFKYLIIKNGDKVTIKDEKNTSIYNKKPNKAFQMLNDILSESVNGKLISDKRFSFNISENSTQYLVELSPDGMETKIIFNKIQLYFLKQNLVVYKIKLIESNNNFTTIFFEDKKINLPIDDRIFINDK